MIIPITIAIAIGAALLATGVHRIIQRRFGYDLLARHNDVAGFVYSAIGVIFAVVLGFVVVVVWETYDKTRADVDYEVASVTDLYHTVAGFSPAIRDRIRAELLQYGNLVTLQEWPTMARGQLAVEASPVMERFAYEIQTFHPVGPTQQDAHQQALSELKQLFDARRQRIRANEPTVPPILWFALFAGALATVGFSYLFGVENQVAQLVMTGSLAALVAIMFVVIQALDSPFHGSSAIKPDGWQYFASRASSIP